MGNEERIIEVDALEDAFEMATFEELDFEELVQIILKDREEQK